MSDRRIVGRKWEGFLLASDDRRPIFRLLYRKCSLPTPIVGCKLTFLTAKPGDLKPPFNATFTDGSGNTFVVSADEIGSADPTAAIPGGWNRVKNVQDYDPQTP